jgi:hypothetical protein
MVFASLQRYIFCIAKFLPETNGVFCAVDTNIVQDMRIQRARPSDVRPVFIAGFCMLRFSSSGSVWNHCAVSWPLRVIMLGLWAVIIYGTSRLIVNYLTVLKKVVGISRMQSPWFLKTMPHVYTTYRMF